MNDEEHHLLYDERCESARCSGHFDDKITDLYINRCNRNGRGLSDYCSYDWEAKVIDLHLKRDSVVYKQVTMTVAFNDAEVASQASFYLNVPKLEPTEISGKSFIFVFDARYCAKWQREATKYFIEISFEYAIAD